MADRPQIPGWKGGATAYNLNKPEEYSSEWKYDGKTYANVTNVSTGQRQLYGVTPVTGARNLISTTNADGTVTKGVGYNTIIGAGGPKLYQTLDAKNKAQSVSLLSNPKIATASEAKNIADSKEFKSTQAGTNAAAIAAGKDGAGTVPVDLKIEGTGKKSGFGNHVYPIDLGKLKQDKIKFSMLRYAPRQFQTVENNLGGVAERESVNKRILGTVILPVPSGISESNATGWTQDTMDPGQAILSNIALTGIQKGLSAGFDKVGDAAAAAAGQGNSEIKNAAAAGFVSQIAGVGGLLSRTQGAVINPNLELLFQGPSLRPFTFSFKMSARNDKEAKEIIKIIRFFKQGMSPQKSSSNLFIKAPHTFKIQYLLGRNDKDHPFIGQIKECALQNFIVNYTPEGQYATFYDGPMVSYEIQMTLQELEPVFNEDYGDDFQSNLLFKAAK